MKNKNYIDIKWVDDFKIYIYNNYVVAFDTEYDPHERCGCQFADIGDVERTAEAKRKLKDNKPPKRYNSAFREGLHW